MLHEFLPHPLPRWTRKKPRWTHKKASPHLSGRTDCPSNSDNALEGSAMFRRSPRCTLEAIDTQSITLVAPVAGSYLERSTAKQAQSKGIEVPSSHAICLSRAREVGVLIEKAAARGRPR